MRITTRRHQNKKVQELKSSNPYWGVTVPSPWRYCSQGGGPREVWCQNVRPCCVWWLTHLPCFSSRTEPAGPHGFSAPGHPMLASSGGTLPATEPAAARAAAASTARRLLGGPGSGAQKELVRASSESAESQLQGRGLCSATQLAHLITGSSTNCLKGRTTFSASGRSILPAIFVNTSGSAVTQNDIVTCAPGPSACTKENTRTGDSHLMRGARSASPATAQPSASHCRA